MVGESCGAIKVELSDKQTQIRVLQQDQHEADAEQTPHHDAPQNREFDGDEPISVSVSNFSNLLTSTE